MPETAPSLSLEDAARPLLEFYQRAGKAAPDLMPIDGSEMPEPYRRLLVHADDMTPTLEEFHGDRIHLRLLGREESEACYKREVVLEAGEDNKPVEFGAIAIHLSIFRNRRARWCSARVCPGTILNEHAIRHESCPQAYFKVQSDPLITEAFGLDASTELYGRCNIHRDLNGNHLAEIVEILPPV